VPREEGEKERGREGERGGREREERGDQYCVK